jgi:redox-sensitive bicupin YhaK (pirin superfamily)
MLVIKGRDRDIGGFSVSRLLPVAQRRLVGPFIFFDHMGPVDFAPGHGIDVLPHPHIGLATVTYLFAGSIVHRDSLGSVETIQPGDVNWMVAGRGIVHSERTAAEARRAGQRLHGVQSWVALPLPEEERGPSFDHFAAAQLPRRDESGVALRVIAGRAYGLAAPVPVFSPMFYLDLDFRAGGRITLPDDYAERALFIATGELAIGGTVHPAGTMVVLEPDDDATVIAGQGARALALGGAPLDGGPRHIAWNFVSSSNDRIERAKAAWRDGRFPPVPNETGFVPLPEP